LPPISPAGAGKTRIARLTSGKPLGHSLRNTVPAQEPFRSGTVHLPLLPGSLPTTKSAPVLLPQIHQQPWRTVHIHDHVVEHHHYYVYNASQSAPLHVESVVPDIERATEELLENKRRAAAHHRAKPVTEVSDMLARARHAHAEQQKLHSSGGGTSFPSKTVVPPEIEEDRWRESLCQSHKAQDALAGIEAEGDAGERAMAAALALMNCSGEFGCGDLTELPANINAGSDLHGDNAGASAGEVFTSAPSDDRYRADSLVAQQLRKALILKAGSVREAFKVFDNNGNGQISLTEWLCGLQTLQIDLSQFRGAPKPAALFQELSNHSGSICPYQLLGADAENPEHMETLQLWRKCASGKKAHKAHPKRRAGWADTPEGTAQLRRIDGEIEKRKSRKAMKKDWHAMRTKEPQDSRMLLHDPRLHRKCASEAIYQPKHPDIEAAVMQEQLSTKTCLTNIKKAMKSCADSRRQVLDLQNLLRPPEVDNGVIAALKGNFLSTTGGASAGFFRQSPVNLGEDLE